MISKMMSDAVIRRSWFWFACFVLYVLLGCQGESMEKAQPQMPPPTRAHTTSSEPFTLTVSRGGGVAGLTTGCSLYADGQVERWEQFPAREPSVLEARRVEPARITAFKQQLEQADILDTTLQESGNVTMAATYDLAGVRHTWVWNAHQTDNVPDALREWHRFVEAFCQQLFASESR